MTSKFINNIGVKLSQLNVNYFVLNLMSQYNVDHLRDKLLSFKDFADESLLLIVSFDKEFSCDQINQHLSLILDLAAQLNLTIYAVDRHLAIMTDSILGVPVIALPSTQKKHSWVYNKTLVVNEPVRSGMCYENDGDVVVTSFVSESSEIIATANIHVYGRARGKLIAGSNGDKSAFIFVLDFDAELIAIGGIYRLIDDKLPPAIQNKSVIISLDEYDRLNIVPCNSTMHGI
ncbi:MAG: septum site-determining protein MinC [Bacteroidia bacterium]|nr:MAG: septum site-determining protein MinC [Bacteroidia bacterium]